jgi:hypothetical protein
LLINSSSENGKVKEFYSGVLGNAVREIDPDSID